MVRSFMNLPVMVLVLCSVIGIANASPVEYTVSASDDVTLSYYWAWPALNGSYGASPTGSTLECSYYHYQGYTSNYRFGALKFDLSQLPAGEVVSAKLRFYANSSESAPSIYYSHDDSWTQNSVSYHANPSNDITLFSNYPYWTNITDQWVEIPLSLLEWDASADLTDGAATMKFYPYGNEYTGYQNTSSFRSMEYGSGEFAPQLVVTVLPVPEPATLSLLGIAGLAILRRRRG